MMKHEQQTRRLEKSPNFFGDNNFLGLNLYNKKMKIFHKEPLLNLTFYNDGFLGNQSWN